MADNYRPSGPAAYHPALATFAAVACAWVFLLVTLGAFTTSIGAGMAFPDWPLSNGSLNPKGWLSTLNLFAEHSHRLSAGIETILSLTLAIWTSRAPGTPRWRRRLAWWAFGICVIQAVVGGLRVLLNHIQLDSLETSVGELFAMVHACLAQALACILLAVAAASSRGWIERPVPVGRSLQKMGVICCALVFVQLAIAAVMRHSFAGLAIPFFPFSTADHHLLPAVWGFKVGIQFAHRLMAAILCGGALIFAVLIWRDRAAPPAMKSGASLVIALLALQVLLGAAIVWSYRDPRIATAHVLVGALTLTTIFWLTWIAHRDRIES